MTSQPDTGFSRETMPNSFQPDDGAGLPSGLKQAVDRRNRSLSSGYRLFYSTPLRIVRGDGNYLYDDQGDEYLDAYNNVPCIGHSHPLVFQRVTEQLGRLNIGNRYLQQEIVDYSEQLLQTVGLDDARVMYTCSGSEANDLAYRVAVGVTGRSGVIVTSNAYHGVTNAVAAFSPSLGDAVPLGLHVRTVEPPRPHDGEDPARVSQRLAEQVGSAIADLERRGSGVAAFVCDTVFTSDGIYFDPAGSLAPAVELVRSHGGLFVADEVQAGFHRTGANWWGFQRHGVEPDIVTMGKAMANGMPLAAAVLRAEVDRGFGHNARYVSTFGGISASIAAASVVLRVLEEEALAARAVEVGERLANGTREAFDSAGLPVDVRQEGLFVAIEPLPTSAPVEKARPPLAKLIVEGLRERRVLASTAGVDGNVVKVRPPMVFGPDEADRFTAALSETLADLVEAGVNGRGQ